MEDSNLVIPVGMLMKAAAYCNVFVSDGVNPQILSFCRLFVSILNPQLQDPSFIVPKPIMYHL